VTFRAQAGDLLAGLAGVEAVTPRGGAG